MEALTPAVFHILLALVDEDRHGYGIMLEIAERTNQQILMGPGTLYGTLKRMLEGALIEECGERIDPDLSNERRRYYRITNGADVRQWLKPSGFTRLCGCSGQVSAKDGTG